MKKNYFKSIIGFCAIISLLSCNEWEQKVDLPASTKPTSGRVVLIEEYTGASCPNCPQGSAALEVILDKYPDNVVVVGVHSNFLANKVVSTDPKLSTPEAQAIEDFMGLYFGKPEATFNRKFFTGQTYTRIGKPDTWITYVDAELKETPVVDLLIDKKYNDVTRELIVDIKCTARVNIDKPVHIHAMITESEIYTSQKGPTSIFANYHQKHVLRKVLSTIPGDKISDRMTQGQMINKTYTYTIPTDPVLWQVPHCDIIAFASYNEVDKYVLQAAETKIQ